MERKPNKKTPQANESLGGFFELIGAYHNMLWWAFLFVGDFLNHATTYCGHMVAIPTANPSMKKVEIIPIIHVDLFCFTRRAMGKIQNLVWLGGLEFVLNLVWVKQTTSNLTFWLWGWGDLYIKSA